MSDLEMVVRVGELNGREVRVEVLASPAGEASVAATFPYDTLALESSLKDLQLALLSRSSTRRRVLPEHEQSVQRFGHDLFESIFTGDVRSILDRSREQAASSGVGLRIQLRFESADMAALPWEFLHDDRTNEYLALSRSTPIVRHVEVAQPQRPLTVARPLRLLAMVASPTDLPGLDADQERRRIEEAVGTLTGRIELHWLEGQTWRDLQSALQRETWHAFHFVGHGGFDASRGEGIVVLCDERGESHRLGASDLGLLLGDHESLRLVVLNSCDGARADRLDIFSSTAAVLVQKGTPAVVAMQYEITDVAAVELSRSFYACLSRGLPVDAALTEARKSVALGLPGTVEWGTPVLYLRAPDGRIFDLGPDDGPLPPPSPALPPPEPASSPRPPAGGWRRHTIAVAAAVATAVVALAGGAFALFARDEGGRAAGLGTFVLDVREGAVASHTLSLPADTVALVMARPLDEELDPDLGVVATRVGTRRLEEYLATAGFDSSDFDGGFDEYDRMPDGRVVARSDEGDASETERLAVLAPFGGPFQVVVGGAAATAGSVELVVRTVEVDAPDDGRDLIDRALDEPAIRTFLSKRAREDLDENGAMNIVPYLEEGEEDIGEIDDAPLVEDGASEPFAEVVAAKLEADGVKPAGIGLSCPPEAGTTPLDLTSWRCDATDGSRAWILVLGEGQWFYDYGPDLVSSTDEIAPPGSFCRDLAGAGWPYFYAVIYWMGQGRPDRLDADLNGIPCETLYSPDVVAQLWGE